METPLPCPFCGGRPTIKPENPKKQGSCWGLVSCENTRCPCMPSVGDGVSVSDERGSDAYKAAAIARWNTRRTNTQPKEG
jgi:hypothetical protein